MGEEVNRRNLTGSVRYLSTEFVNKCLICIGAIMSWDVTNVIKPFPHPFKQKNWERETFISITRMCIQLFSFSFSGHSNAPFFNWPREFSVHYFPQFFVFFCSFFISFFRLEKCVSFCKSMRFRSRSYLDITTPSSGRTKHYAHFSSSTVR